MISIYDKNGGLRLQVVIAPSDIYHKELMASEYVQLDFKLAQLVRLRRGDYIDTEFGRFSIVNVDSPLYDPKTGAYKYEQKFHAGWEWWRNYILYYNRQEGAEKAWRMTNAATAFMDIVTDNIARAGLGTYSYEVDAAITEMKLIEFDATDIVAALNRIAETFESEWYITGSVIHLRRCEYGTAVSLSLDDTLSRLDRDASQDTLYVTRLVAFGSTRNLPEDYRSDEDTDLIREGVVEKRLKLPVGIPYIDAWPNIADEDIVEGVAIFDEVYPKRLGTIETISTKEYTDTIEHIDGTTTITKWNAYRFTDSGLLFSKDYVLPGQELRVVFQTGNLAGMDFAVTFNPDGVADEASPAAQIFEVVRTDEYGVYIPNDTMHPDVGDNYILYGFDIQLVSDQYVEDAENELLLTAQTWLAKNSEDKSVYTADTNIIRAAGYTQGANGELEHDEDDEIDLDVGRRVRLVDSNYFDAGYKDSRIRMFEKHLDNKFNATYTIGEMSVYSTSSALEQKVDALIYQTDVYKRSSSGVYVIAVNDGTAPTDTNVYSALRSDKQYLRKDRGDTAQGHITFNSGLTSNGDVDVNGETETDDLVVNNEANVNDLNVENEAVFGGDTRSDNYETGISGWGVDGYGNAEFESIRARSYIMTEEMLINRLQGQEGDTLFSDNDQIEAVESFIDETDGSTHYILTLKEKWEGYFTAQQVGNIVKGIVNTYAAKDAGVSDYTSAADLVYQDKDNGGNYFYTSYMQVVATHNTASARLDVNQIEVVLYGDSEVPAQKNFPPCELMTIARRGCYLNPNDYPEGSAERQSIERRQRLFEISVTDGRIMKLTGVMSPILQQGNFGVTIGTLPEFVQRYPVVAERMADGDFLYAQGVVVGDFIKIDKVGTPIPQPIYPQVGWVSGQDLIDAGQTPTPGYGIYYANHWNEDTRQYETHYVTHRGVLWQCLQSQPVKSGNVYTYYEPKWNSPYWRLVDGNENITMEFDSSRGYSFRRGAVDTTITPYVFYGNVDITDDIANEFWLWTRESESGKTPQDNTWDAQHTGQRVLHLTNSDMPQTWSSSDKAIFTCTATINDGKTTRIVNNQIIS